MRFSASAPASLPVIEPRRPPTHTVTVMSTSSDRPLVVMLLSANRACDSIAFCSDTIASSAPALFACASTVSQIFRAASRVSMTGPVPRTLVLNLRAEPSCKTPAVNLRVEPLW
jgi:hypothetical protein